jgi:hypothetical protein
VKDEGYARRRSRWIMKKLWIKPFKKESKVDDTKANIKEGENTNQKTPSSKATAYEKDEIMGIRQRIIDGDEYIL